MSRIFIKNRIFESFLKSFTGTRIVILAALLLSGCASYTQKTESVRAKVLGGQYQEALTELDASDLATQDRDRVLYFMERGSINYLLKNYGVAAQDWGRASDRAEQLFTVSLTRQAASLAINDSFADYEGESFERVMLPVMSALAYFANNELGKSLVEVRKAYQVLNVIKQSDNGKKTFTRDGFAHYLSGLVYEAKQEWDSAIIEYRAALEDGEAAQNKGVATVTIAEGLGRLAEYRKRNEIVTGLRQKFPGIQWIDHKTLMKQAEVYVIYESGRVPIKVPQDIVLPVSGSVVRVSFPTYKELGYMNRSLSVSLNGQSFGRTKVMQDIGENAQQSLSDRRTRDIVRMAARVLAKDQASRATGRAFGPLGQLAVSVAGAVTESADTRGWTSLPDTIQVLRVPVPANQASKLKFETETGYLDEVSVTLQPGQKKLLRFRTSL